MTGQRIVPFSYLDRQFADVEPYLQDLRQLVRSGDFTLGQALSEFETTFCTVSRMPYAVGVASGTDALEISLRVLKIGPGDEVITAVNTFIATVDAIVMTGARPVLVDNEDGFTIDPEKIEEAITPKTRAIIPVHLTGNMADMPAIMRIARARGIHVVEDACQAIEAELDGQSPGHWGETAAYSLHPLKNLNLWGEAGVVVTRTAALSDEIRTFRN